MLPEVGKGSSGGGGGGGGEMGSGGRWRSDKESSGKGPPNLFHISPAREHAARKKKLVHNPGVGVEGRERGEGWWWWWLW